MKLGELRVLLEERPEDPYMNLSIEEALFISRCRDDGDDILRIWRNKNAVVIGVFQVPEEEVDLEYAKNNGIAITRRFTGGGAVYHDLGNINFAFSTKVPEGEKGGVDYLFNYLINGAIYALEKLGFSPKKENYNDIIIDGKKTIGIAGSIRRNCAFIHGAMLYNTNLSVLSSVLKVPLKKLAEKKVSSVKYRVTTISQIRNDIRERDVVNALIYGFMRVKDLKGFYLDFLSEKEFDLSLELYKNKYSTYEWNYERKRP
jgi:lipoate-protein ligase A